MNHPEDLRPVTSPSHCYRCAGEWHNTNTTLLPRQQDELCAQTAKPDRLERHLWHAAMAAMRDELRELGIDTTAHFDPASIRLISR